MYDHLLVIIHAHTVRHAWWKCRASFFCFLARFCFTARVKSTSVYSKIVRISIYIVFFPFLPSSIYTNPNGLLTRRPPAGIITMARWTFHSSPSEKFFSLSDISNKHRFYYHTTAIDYNHRRPIGNAWCRSRRTAMKFTNENDTHQWPRL